MTLSGKRVFVTGGSRGIGLEIAKRIARDGAKVAIAAKTAEPNPKLPGTIFSAAEEIEAAGGTALPLVTDIRDENAIVDFKYSPHPGLTWWFDHHQSAFLSPADAEHFRTQRIGHYFFDPTYKSCTLFIATIAREKFGYHNSALDNLVKWADIIDGAQYSNADEAVGLGAAAMKLTLVIESAKGSEIVQRIIGHMRTKSLDEIIALPEIDIGLPLDEIYDGVEMPPEEDDGR